jgi:hypothetical protein
MVDFLIFFTETARLIADKIEAHSERGNETVFVDSDGGLCLVTREIQRRNLFKSPEANVVMERDPSLSVIFYLLWHHFSLFNVESNRGIANSIFFLIDFI